MLVRNKPGGPGCCLYFVGRYDNSFVHALWPRFDRAGERGRARSEKET